MSCSLMSQVVFYFKILNMVTKVFNQDVVKEVNITQTNGCLDLATLKMVKQKWQNKLTVLGNSFYSIKTKLIKGKCNLSIHEDNFHTMKTVAKLRIQYGRHRIALATISQVSLVLLIEWILSRRRFMFYIFFHKKYHILDISIVIKKKLILICFPKKEKGMKR